MTSYLHKPIPKRPQNSPEFTQNSTPKPHYFAPNLDFARFHGAKKYFPPSPKTNSSPMSPLRMHKKKYSAPLAHKNLISIAISHSDNPLPLYSMSSPMSSLRMRKKIFRPPNHSRRHPIAPVFLSFLFSILYFPYDILSYVRQTLSHPWRTMW